MRLAYDWKRIVRRAWSWRLNALAFLFGGAEIVLPLYMDYFPRHLFAVLSLVAVGGSMWARLVKQKDFY